jgi:hypothetical protein
VTTYVVVEGHGEERASGIFSLACGSISAVARDLASLAVFSLSFWLVG